MALQRYEVLYEAGLVPESPQDSPLSPELVGRRMQHDHRRILATGIARLRAKIKYRPVVFELLPPSFTLLQLQDMRRGAGRPAGAQAELPPPDDRQGLMEETGESRRDTGGRPAKWLRFRREVLRRAAPVGRHASCPPLRLTRAIPKDSAPYMLTLEHQ